MSGPKGAPCTKFLKKYARQEWELRNPVDWHVLGFGAEERARAERFMLTERPNLLPILVDHGITREGLAQILQAAGIKLPRIYDMGYPNGNCSQQSTDSL